MECTTGNSTDFIAIIVSIIALIFSGLSYWQARKANKINIKAYILEIKSSYRRLKDSFNIHGEVITKEDVIKEYHFLNVMVEDHIKGPLCEKLKKYYEEIFFIAMKKCKTDMSKKSLEIQKLELSIDKLFDKIIKGTI